MPANARHFTNRRIKLEVPKYGLPHVEENMDRVCDQRKGFNKHKNCKEIYTYKQKEIIKHFSDIRSK